MSDTHHNPLTPTPHWSLAISRRRHHWWRA